MRSHLAFAKVARAVLVLAAAVACSQAPPAGPTNVLLITLDATRADAIGRYAPAGLARTPHLDALAAESLFFEDAVASTPYTGPAHASILTGQYPPQHGMRDYLQQSLPASADTLAERFRAAGYQTAAFVSAYVLAPRFGLDQGFDVYAYRPRRPAVHADPQKRALAQAFYQRPANETVDEAIEWFTGRDRERPFFAWIHLYDAHAPWTPPASVRRPEPTDRTIGDAERARRLYYDEVTFMDQQIGRLLRGLEDMSLAGATVVAVTADHGELLGHHGRLLGGHSPEIVEATVHVPLFVRVAGREPAVVKASVRALDLFPTLLEAAGLDVPDGIEGRSLLAAGDETNPRPAYSETLYNQYPKRAASGDELVSLRVGRWKLVEGPERVELFDLSRDPDELLDRRAASPAQLARLRSELATLRARFKGAPPGANLDLTNEEMSEHLEGLRALGYVE
jgi:choline-sulfatase